MRAEHRTEPPREPRQARSKQRVEQILAAARTLVLVKGFAGLKMAEIAATAGVSTSSIYQYFPNKRAIVLHLAQRHLELGRRGLEAMLDPRPTDIDELGARVDAAVEVYYQQLRADPLVLHLRKAFAADTQLREMEAQDTLELEALLFASTKHLFRRSRHAQVRMAVRLLVEFIDVGLAMALELDGAQAEAMMKILYQNLDACWEASILPHAAAQS